MTRIEGEPEIVSVRKPFVEAFSEAHSFYIDPGIFATGSIEPSFAEFSKQLRSDFSSFLTTVGCTSGAVRYFEINLYLADRWFLPIQELQH